ncbi:MAG: neutral/alkaline non-lysosomal ceramidase N-terminal domain-containing protein [Planctomycetaceae bacterium]
MRHSLTRHRLTLIAIGLMAFAMFLVVGSPVFADGWKAGAAAVVITPRVPMPMAGYASRGATPADGTLTDLFAKALVIEDPQGNRGLLITLDLVGIEREFATSITAELIKSTGLRRDQIVLAASHTHTGPVVARNLRPMHYLLFNEANRKLVDTYANELQQQLITLANKSIANLKPATLSYHSGSTDFAVNRRTNKEADVPMLRAENKLLGPVDHDVPVLAVHCDDKLAAVVFGYACHCTVLSLNQWSGDYAGFAQQNLEKSHPGCVALFWAGCGADQNPLPRRTVELAQSYGKQLADAVHTVLESPLHPIVGSLSTTYHEVPLPFATLPTRDELTRDTSSSNIYIAARAKSLLATLDAGESLSDTYPYPVSTWKLGSDLIWVALGGEVVVDYAIRIKDELGSPTLKHQNVWVTAYAHDVMAYIPSRRVLAEGGYEGGGAMIYYGLPTVWAPEVENVIINEVHRQSAD